MVSIAFFMVGCSQDASGNPVGVDKISSSSVAVSLSSSGNSSGISSGASSSSALSSGAVSSSSLSSSSSSSLSLSTDFAAIPKGSFVRFDGAVVHIDSILMSKTEMTASLYKELIGLDPSSHTDVIHRPIEQVSWYDALLFCNQLSRHFGLDTVYQYTGTSGLDGILLNLQVRTKVKGFRLPTEAEFEYAARAGATTVYSWGDEVTGLTPGRYTNPDVAVSPSPVGSYLPNAWGLFDMEGNLWEWTWDWYGALDPTSPVLNPTGPSSGTERVLKGGVYDAELTERTLATRYKSIPMTYAANIGFRVVLQNP